MVSAISVALLIRFGMASVWIQFRCRFGFGSDSFWIRFRFGFDSVRFQFPFGLSWSSHAIYATSAMGHGSADWVRYGFGWNSLWISNWIRFRFGSDSARIRFGLNLESLLIVLGLAFALCGFCHGVWLCRLGSA